MARNPKPAPPVPHLFESLVHLQHDLGREFSARVGLPLARLGLLHELAHAGDGGCGVNDLARELGVTPALITRQVHELERAGWVRRRADSKDRRRNWVLLSAAGWKEMLRIHALVHSFEEEALAGIKPSDLAVTTRVLSLVSSRLAPGRSSPRPELFAGRKGK